MWLFTGQILPVEFCQEKIIRTNMACNGEYRHITGQIWPVIEMGLPAQGGLKEFAWATFLHSGVFWA
jgi:hypothetical protein